MSEISEAAIDRARAGSHPPFPLMASLAVLAALWYVVMEWLFFATAISFLSSLDGRERALLPGAAVFVIAVATVAATTLAWLPVRFAGEDRLATFGRRLALAPPAGILALSALLLFDNFIHTVLHTGLTMLGGPWRWLRPLLAALLFLACLERLDGWAAAAQRRPRVRRALGAIAVVTSVFAAASIAAFPRAGLPSAKPAKRAPGAPMLNVLLLGGDGIEAGHTSLYGYDRPTTPFLASLAKESLVGERTYVNAPVTGASLTSILTGMLPTRTGVVYPPDVARGPATRQHLPGILRTHGYARAQLTIRYYGDAGDLNLVDSFEVANGRRLEAAAWSGLGLDRFVPSLRLFLTILAERAEDRALPAARPGSLAFGEATGEAGSFLPDQARIEALYSFVRGTRQPFFVHVHLLATHGPNFRARSRVEGEGRGRGGTRTEPSYDDAIRDFDQHVEGVFSLLRRQRLLERTLVVVYSDHGRAHEANRPVPLLFRFPGGAHAGKIHGLTQTLDIAPTILDALDIPIPATMGGWSLLRGEPPCRPVIFAVPNLDLINKVGVKWFVVPRPPFFSLGALTLLDGRASYALTVTRDQLDVAPLPAAPWCPEIGAERARELLVEELVASGYDVSSLRPASLAAQPKAAP